MGKHKNAQTFFTNNLWQALDYAQGAIEMGDKTRSNCRVVLNVDLDTNILAPDNDDYIDCDTIDCNTWEQSLEDTTQVVNGAVPTSRIRNIYLYNEYEDNEFWSGSLGEYLSKADHLKDYLLSNNKNIPQGF